MKSYMTQRQWRLVGKAWEISEYLRRQARQTNEDIAVCDWLAQRTTPIADNAAPQLRLV